MEYFHEKDLWYCHKYFDLLVGEVFWLAYFDSQIRKSIILIYNLEYKGFDIQLRIPSPMTFETCICSNSTLRY